MPTDQEKFEILMIEFGVPFNTQVCQYGEQTGCVRYVIDDETDNPKVKAYGGFYTEFVFDAQGKFMNIGIFE